MGCLEVNFERLGGDLDARFQRIGGDLTATFSLVCGTGAGLSLVATSDHLLLTEKEGKFLSVTQND